MGVMIQYNFSGENEQAGHLSVVAKHRKNHVTMEVVAIRKQSTPLGATLDIKTPVAKVTFKKTFVSVEPLG